MDILNDPTAMAVVGSLKSVGYSLADVTSAWTGPAPSTVSPFIFGTNPGNAPSVQGTVAAMQHFGMKIARFWTTGPFTAPPAPSLWTGTLQYAAADIQNVAVLNFQNSAVRCKAPALADWTNYLNAIPSPANTGITYFEIGNEIDFAAYFSDTPVNYAALLQIAAPILRAKGYKIICGNVLYGLTWLNTLAGLGAMANCDYVGRHAYESNAAAALNDYQALIAFANAQGKGVFCTEVGLHGNAANLPAWAAETQKLYAGVKALNGTLNTQLSTLNVQPATNNQQPATFLQFPLFPTGTTASPQSLLQANGQPNEPFYSAAEKALAIQV
jgi:hypothetical protein